MDHFERVLKGHVGLNIQLILNRFSTEFRGGGARRGPTALPPPPGVVFRVGTPLESKFGRARPESVLESNQKYAISTLIKDES